MIRVATIFYITMMTNKHIRGNRPMTKKVSQAVCFPNFAFKAYCPVATTSDTTSPKPTSASFIKAIPKILLSIVHVVIITSSLSGCALFEKKVVILPSNELPIQLEKGQIFTTPFSGWYVQSGTLIQCQDKCLNDLMNAVILP